MSSKAQATQEAAIAWGRALSDRALIGHGQRLVTDTEDPIDKAVISQLVIRYGRLVSEAQKGKEKAGPH